MKLEYRLSRFALVLSFLAHAASAQPVAPPPTGASAPVTDTVLLPAPLADPIEPFNRAMWNFDKSLAKHVVQPFSTGYRFVVVKPLRIGIANAGRNLTYPGRFINELLQGRGQAAGDETARCVCNTVLGLGGLFDVASRWDIPKPEADFGQTFKKWGYQPGIFLMLPLLGPSDVRDGTGLVADYAANPLSYFTPFSYISPGVAVNNISDTVDESVRFTEVQADSYSILNYAWTITHENRTVDFRLQGPQNQALLETLQSFFVSSNNPVFLRRGTTRSVLIPATGQKLAFTYWLQPGHAPVVDLIPGFGAHRLDGNELALAEFLATNGFSVVCVSSPFHPEFMEHAATSDLPAYPPDVAADLRAALTEIDHWLAAKYPHRLGSKALLGYSMGAFQSLYLAATADTNTTSPLAYQRYVSIDAPVRLRYVVTNLDSFYQAPLAWPAAERTDAIENTLLKAAALTVQPPAAGANLPFSTVESEFLIGLSFRLTLRDIIYSSQLRHNQGAIHAKLQPSRRQEAYDEILRYSFRDYVDKFAAPYEAARGINLEEPETLRRATDLEVYTASLKANPNIRLILNRNDFILAPEDIAWIEATFAPAQVSEFPDGGHLGNLAQPAVQRAILHALDGLDNSTK